MTLVELDNVDQLNQIRFFITAKSSSQKIPNLQKDESATLKYSANTLYT